MEPRRKTVLLVEDNDNDAELARTAFARCGVPVDLIVAEDGFAAGEILFDHGRQPPDLVLLDLKLPGIDGFEVLRRLRGDDALRSLSVVVFTSSAEESDIDRSLRGGANSYVRKPVDFDEFLDVAQLIARYWLVLHQTPVAGTNAHRVRAVQDGGVDPADTPRGKDGGSS